MTRVAPEMTTSHLKPQVNLSLKRLSQGQGRSPMNKGTSLELWRKGQGCSLGLSKPTCRSSLLRIQWWRIMRLLKLRGKGIGEDEGSWGSEENTFDYIKEWMRIVGWRDVYGHIFTLKNSNVESYSLKKSIFCSIMSKVSSTWPWLKNLELALDQSIFKSVMARVSSTQSWPKYLQFD